MSRRLLNLAERGGSGAEHSAITMRVRIADRGGEGIAG